MFTQIFSQPKTILKRANAFQSACLIFNPISGQNNPQHDLEIIQTFLQPYLNLDIYLTSLEKGAEQLAIEAVNRGVELLIASGGDGTVSAVAKATIGTNIPLAIIPRGTANAFAHGLGLPLTLEESCLAILQGAMLTVDTALCNNQPMLLLAGIGFEANTVKEADRQLKDQLGIFAYILAGLDQLKNLENFEVTLETESLKITVNASAITVANFAPPTSILAQGIGSNRPDDGLLDVTIIAPLNALEALSQAIELFECGIAHSNTENNHIGYLRVQKINITTNPPQPITLDGEMIEGDSIIFEVIPASIKVVASYQKVMASQEKLVGLPNLMIIENENQKLEPLVLDYLIPVNLAHIFSEVSSEIGEALLSLWHSFTKGIKVMSNALIETIIYLFWRIIKIFQGETPSTNLNLRSYLETSNLVSNYQIIHHIGGRIRLKIPRLRKDEKYADRLQSLIQSLTAVETVKINPYASSMTVNYSPTQSKIQFQETLIELIGQAT